LAVVSSRLRLWRRCVASDRYGRSNGGMGTIELGFEKPWLREIYPFGNGWVYLSEARTGAGLKVPLYLVAFRMVVSVSGGW